MTRDLSGRRWALRKEMLGTALAGAVILLLGVPSWAQVVSPIQGFPPVVVRTEPVSGETHVDPRTQEIRITFSKRMMDKSWSLVQWSKETFPAVTGPPGYLEDQRTCVVPVKLEPGKCYVIWVNTEKHINFKDEDGRSALPYLLAFETSGK